MYGRRTPFHLPHDEPDPPFPDLTPLVDIVFVLLILFICITPLLEAQRIDLTTARTQSTRTPPNDMRKKGIRIEVGSDDTIRINGTLVTEKELPERLRAYGRQYPGCIPEVYPDKHTFFKTYQAVKDGLESAEFAEMEVILKNP
ncbi:MAG: biopolymer transporter ExbD [Simkaniaceae bacterium]|nr:biopolymer transporter ExbD [Simkaniaceae bacterium]